MNFHQNGDTADVAHTSRFSRSSAERYRLSLPSFVMSAPQSKDREQLPGLTPRRTTSSVSSGLRRAAKTTLLALAALAITAFFARITHKQLWHCIQSASLNAANDDLCPQAPELIPVKNNALWQTLTEIYGTEAFRTKAIEWLSGAVQIP